MKTKRTVRKGIGQVLNESWVDIRSGIDIPSYIIVIVGVAYYAIRLLKINLPYVGADLDKVLLPGAVSLLLFKAIRTVKLLNELNSPNQNSIKVYDSWTSPEVYEAITKARVSVDILMSWMPDPGTMADCINKAYDRSGNKNFKVNILILNSKIGSERYKQVNNILDNKEAQDGFVAAVNTMKRDFRSRGAKIQKIVNYKTYNQFPTIKLIIIDKKHYIWGWFPDHRPGAAVPCLTIEAGKDNNENLIYDLEEHFQSILQSAT